MDMLEQNYKTFCSTNNMVIICYCVRPVFPSSALLLLFAFNGRHFIPIREFMIPKPLENPFDIKAKVIGVLESTGMAEMRAAKCDIDDFLK